MAKSLCGFDAAVRLSCVANPRSASVHNHIDLLDDGSFLIETSSCGNDVSRFHVSSIVALPLQVDESTAHYFMIMSDGKGIFVSCKVRNQLKQFHEYLATFAVAANGDAEPKQWSHQSLLHPAEVLASPSYGFDFDQHSKSVVPSCEMVMFPVHWRIPNFAAAVANDVLYLEKSIPQDLFPGIQFKLTLIQLGRSQIHVKFALALNDKKSSATALIAGFELAFTSLNGMERVQRSLLAVLDAAGHSRGCSYQRDEVVRLCSSEGAIILRGEIRLKSPTDSRLALRRMYENGSSFSDFRIKVADRTLNVHKCVLAELSQTFKEACLDSNELEIRGATPDAVKAMLQFVYCDPLCLKGLWGLAFDVYLLAENFKLSGLCRLCEEALHDLMGKSNVFALASWALRHNAEFLCNRALEYICSDFCVFAKTAEEWASIRAKHPDVAAAICDCFISAMEGEIAAYLDDGYPSAKKAKTSSAVTGFGLTTPSNAAFVPEKSVSVVESFESPQHVASAPPSNSCSQPPAKQATLVSSRQLNDLSDAELEEIFKRLPLYERLIVAEVCRRWHRISRKAWLDVKAFSLVRMPGEHISDVVDHCQNLESVFAAANCFDVNELKSLAKLPSLSRLSLFDCECELSQETLNIVQNVFSGDFEHVPLTELIISDVLFFVLPDNLKLYYFQSFTFNFTNLPASLTRLQLSGVLFPEDMRMRYLLDGLERLVNLECFILHDTSARPAERKFVHYEHLSFVDAHVYGSQLFDKISQLKNLKELCVGSASFLGTAGAELGRFVAELPKLEVLFLTNIRGQGTAEDLAQLVTRNGVLRILVLMGDFNTRIDLPARKRFPNGFGVEPLPILHIFVGKEAADSIRFVKSPSDTAIIHPINAPMPEFLDQEAIAPIFEGVWVADKLRETAENGGRLLWADRRVNFDTIAVEFI